MLLVLFFHPRALLLLPQCSHIFYTGSSRAPLKTASVGQHVVFAMECIAVYWSRDKFPILFTLDNSYLKVTILRILMFDISTDGPNHSNFVLAHVIFLHQ